jgi:hypothetical protein
MNRRQRTLLNTFNKYHRRGKSPADVPHKIQAAYAEWLRTQGGEELMSEQKADAKKNAKVEKKTAKKKGLFKGK